MKKVLLVDESSLFREFIGHKLTESGFEVVYAVNGLDGAAKLRNEVPELMIMDYHLSRTSSLELLESKKSDPNTAEIPVLMCSTRIEREKLMEVARFGVKKFFTKPVKVDALVKYCGELLGQTVDFDSTPCIIEAHVNEDIIFVEVARGLNREKMELLRYKIKELVGLYELKVPKVLVIMSSVEVGPEDSLKLSAFFDTLVKHTDAKLRHIKILTNSEFIARYIRERDDLDEIEVTNNLEKAMDGLLGRKSGSFMDGENRVVQQEFLRASAPKKTTGETIDMKFQEEIAGVERFSLTDLPSDVTVAVVDDDFVIQELVKTVFSDTNLTIHTYDNGRQFVDDAKALEADLVFLDLMMPEMDGFGVLDHLKKQGVQLPIIVLSALSKRETVIRALTFGVKSYLIKPLQPDSVRKKAAEILSLSF